MNAYRSKALTHWLIIAASFLLMLSSCGSSGSPGSSDSSGSSSAISTTVGSISAISSTKATMTANGQDTSVIKATVLNDQNKPLSGVSVNFYKDYSSTAALGSRTTSAAADNTFTDKGNKVTGMFYSSGGNTTFTFNCDGDDYFSVWLWSSEEGRIALLVNKTDSFKNAQAVEDLNPGNYFFEVNAGSQNTWTIEIAGQNAVHSSRELLATSKTNSSGVASYTYKSTIVKSKFKIVAEVNADGKVYNKSTQITQKAGAPETLELKAPQNSIYANGKTTTILSAMVRDHYNNLVEDGISVSFTTTDGTFVTNGNATASADTRDGVADIELQSGITAGSPTITAKLTGIPAVAQATVTVKFTKISMTDMVAVPSTLIYGKDDQSIVTVHLKDENGIALVGETINFSTNAGTLEAGSTKTNDHGVATVNFFPSADDGSATITAKYGLIEKTCMIIVKTEDTTSGASLSLSTTKVSIKTNDTDTATITAKVLDANMVPLENAIVNFTTTGGQISAPSATTNDQGNATIDLSSGPAKTNQIITITADIQNLSSIIPIQLSGSTVALNVENTSLMSGNNSSGTTLTITAKDGGEAPVYNADVVISQSTSDSGSLTLTAASGSQPLTPVSGNLALTPVSGKTDVNGKLTVNVKGDKSGHATLRVTALGDTKEQNFTISGEPFEIINPESSPISKNTGKSFSITVRSPDNNPVKFTASMGYWNDNGDNGANRAVTTTSDSAGYSATAIFYTGNTSGTATVSVEDATDPTINDTLLIAIAAPSSEATKLSLQVAPSVIAPSVGSITNVATLRATVRNINNQVVSDAPVLFSLFRTTGGGEKISQPIVYTGDNGVAETTFASGSLDSGSHGVFCLAKIEGAAVAGPDNEFSLKKTSISRQDNGNFISDGFKPEDSIRVSGSKSNDGTYTISTVKAGTLTLTPTTTLKAEENPGEMLVIATADNTDVVAVKISGTSSSVAIGAATKIEALSESVYKYPMSVLVADSNGNPVKGAVVNLSVWPTYYYTGTTGLDGPEKNKKYPNEDQNKNEILDAGEDTNGDPAGADLTANNGQLDPAKSAAGTVPSTVITDKNGVAQFDYFYLKQYAGWLDVEIQATTFVYGSESSSSILKISLPWAKNESSSIPDSPWGP